eukprot:m.1172820 g.1172820  ORF g.1172820 m.1172820 type:complete len:1080 (+) comp24519_c0_seq30:287-3526(+)
MDDIKNGVAEGQPETPDKRLEAKIQENELDVSTEGDESGVDQSSDVEDDNDVFEIIDFTTASPWECLAADIEKHLRAWGLAAGNVEERTKESKNTRTHVLHSQEAIVDMRGRAYTLRYVRCAESENRRSATVDVNRGSSKISAASTKSGNTETSPGSHSFSVRNLSSEVVRAFQDGGFETIPQWMAALLNANSIFSTQAHDHPLSQWYGLDEFLLVTPASTKYTNRIMQSEAKMILSALSVALVATGCQLPGFTQVDDAAKGNFHGCAMAGGMHSAFDAVRIPAVPKAYSHLSGLLALFRSNLPALNPRTRVSIAARFTYTLPNWFDDWLPENARQLSRPSSRSPSRSNSRTGSPAVSRTSSNSDNDVQHYGLAPEHALKVGKIVDPVKAIQLFTTWPHFHENAVLENAVYSELDPNVAPMWSVRAETHLTSSLSPPLPPRDTTSTTAAKTLLFDTASAVGGTLRGSLGRHVSTAGRPARSLADTVTEFARILDCPYTWTDIQEAAEDNGQGGVVGFAEDDESADDVADEGAARRDDVLAKLQGRGAARGGVAVAMTTGLKNMVGNTLRNTVGRVVDRRGGGTSAGDALGPGKMLLTDDEIDSLIWPRIFGTDDWDPDASTAAASRGRAKSAPRGSLVYELATLFAQVNVYGGGLAALCVLWQDVVLDIELNFWKQLKSIPRVACHEHSPDMRHCLVYQKMQMVNCCIDKQRVRDELIRNRSGKPPDAAPGRSTPPAADDDDDDAFHSADDDEHPDAPDPEENAYYLAPEDERGMLERLERVKSEASDSTTITESATTVRPSCVAAVSETLTLLRAPHEPLRIPITQEEGPMTEDMLELWHSPRDYIVDDNGDAASGHLSERMSQPGNLWQTIWDEAEPRPVNRQRALFDATREALSAINYLTNIKPADLVLQLLPALLEAAEDALMEACETVLDDHDAILDEIDVLHDLRKKLTNNVNQDVDIIKAAIAQVDKVETMLSTAQSLAHKLGSESIALVGGMLSGDAVPLLEEKQRTAVKNLFLQHGNELEAPDTREFIFRVVAPSPSSLSRPGANRMYCLLSDEMFRVAGAYSEDKVFST